LTVDCWLLASAPFLQAPRKFSSGVPGKMGYEDFVWFILSEEDKTTDTAMEYWFRCGVMLTEASVGRATWNIKLLLCCCAALGLLYVVELFSSIKRKRNQHSRCNHPHLRTHHKPAALNF
jgi:hypothetical protein